METQRFAIGPVQLPQPDGGWLAQGGGDLALVGEELALVGEDFALVGEDLALVGEDFALVGEEAAQVGEDLALVGEDLALVGGELALLGEDFALVGEEAAQVGEEEPEWGPWHRRWETATTCGGGAGDDHDRQRLVRPAWALGLAADHLAAWQMAWQAAIVHPVGIAFAQAGGKRFIGKFTTARSKAKAVHCESTCARIIPYAIAVEGWHRIDRCAEHSSVDVTGHPWDTGVFLQLHPSEN